MKNFITVKKNSPIIITAAFLFLFFQMGMAQTAGGNSSGNKKYVKMVIGHGALHCPFLGPKFISRLDSIQGIQNLFVDKQNSYATFNLPADTKMNLDLLQKIGIDAGYAASDVIVTLDNIPILTAVTPK